MTTREQAALDAQADAATVWLASARRPWLREQLREARYYGARAKDYASDREPTISVDPADVAYWAARVSARAAFIGCPSLREDRREL